LETRCRRGKTSRGKVLRGRLFDAPPSRRRTMESTNKGKTQETLRSGAGCNKPATLKRRKPSRWCKTTRVEQGLKRGCFGSEHSSTDGWGEDALRDLDERGVTRSISSGRREKSGRSPREEGSKAPRGAMGEPGTNRSASAHNTRRSGTPQGVSGERIKLRRSAQKWVRPREQARKANDSQF